MLGNSSGKLQGREASALRFACSRMLPHPVTICQLPKSVETEDPGREWSADLGQRERETLQSVGALSHTPSPNAAARDARGRLPAAPVPAALTPWDQGAACSSAPGQAFPLKARGEPGQTKQQKCPRGRTGQSQREAGGHAEL